MKILILVNTYHPSDDGVAVVTRYHAEELVNRGHEVTLLTPRWNCPVIEEELNGVNIRRVDIRSRNGIYKGHIKEYVEEVIKLANESDVLMAVALQTVIVDPILKHLDRIKCRKVLYMHGMWDFSWHHADVVPPIHILYKLWSNARQHVLYPFGMKNVALFDDVVQLSEKDSAYDYFRTHGVRHQTIIQNAVDDNFWIKHEMTDSFKAKYDLPESYAICVATYIKRKNQEFLVRAFSKMKNRGIKLICVGNEKNAYYDYVTGLADKLGIDYDFKYSIPREDVACLIQNSKMFLLGALAEKQPVCIFEAMASGVPFISTNVGDVYGRPGGIVVDTPEEMAEAIDELMSDESRRVALAEEGYKFAKDNLIRSKAVDKLEKVLFP